MRQRETTKVVRAMDWLLVIKVSRQCSNSGWLSGTAGVRGGQRVGGAKARAFVYY